MNFQHTDDRRMLADSLNRFVAEQYGFETRDRIAKVAPGCSPELWRQFADLGVIGALFGEDDGGFAGGGFIYIAVVFEALGRGLVVEPFLPTVLAGSAIAHAGNPAQKALLAEIIGGTRIAAFAHAEPDAQHAFTQVHTRVQRVGAQWQLDGAKAVVQHAEQADVFVVSARSAGAVDDEAGVSLFIVPAGTPGPTLRGYPTIDGGRAAELTLAGVTLGADALLGAEGRRRDDRAQRRQGRARAVRRGGGRDGRRQGRDARIPAHAQAVRRADRQLPGAAAPRWPTCWWRSNRRARR